MTNLLVALSLTILSSPFISAHKHHNHQRSHPNPDVASRSYLNKPSPDWYAQQLKSRALDIRAANSSTPSYNSTGLEGTCKDESSLVASIVKLYPPVGSVATIVKGDTQATALYNQMLANKTMTALTIPPKGTSGANEQGEFTGYKYDSKDPDCWWTYNLCVKPKVPYLGSDIDTCPEPATWGLTFDDGPSCQHGPLYDLLLANKQLATMFFIGANVLTYPLEAQRAVNDGHEVCIHTWSHHYTTALTTEEVFAELYYTKKVIKDVTGLTTRCWRPPYGDTDDRVRSIAHFLDLTTIIWDNDTNDWEIDEKGFNAQIISQNFAEIIGNVSQTHGTIVLDHELNVDDMKEFITEYPKITAAFKHVTPVSTCQNITHPYAEGQYTYPDFASYVSGDRTPTFPTGWTIKDTGNISLTQTGVQPPSNSAPSTTTLVNHPTTTSSSSHPNSSGSSNSTNDSSNTGINTNKSGSGRVAVGLGALGSLIGMIMLV